MSATTFNGDDTTYHAWLSEHPHGYVVNTRRRRWDPEYLVLHRATCVHISRGDNPGAYTERAYIKICADKRNQLVDQLSRKTGRKHPFSKLCAHCCPDG